MFTLYLTYHHHACPFPLTSWTQHDTKYSSVAVVSVLLKRNVHHWLLSLVVLQLYIWHYYRVSHLVAVSLRLKLCDDSLQIPKRQRRSVICSLWKLTLYGNFTVGKRDQRHHLSVMAGPFRSNSFKQKTFNIAYFMCSNNLNDQHTIIDNGNISRYIALITSALPLSGKCIRKISPLYKMLWNLHWQLKHLEEIPLRYRITVGLLKTAMWYDVSMT